MVLTPYVYPNSQLDQPYQLLELVGSFWADTFAGSDLVASLLHARAQLETQSRISLQELVAAMNRDTIPTSRLQNWRQLRFVASEVNRTELNAPRFGDAGESYSLDFMSRYGERKRSEYFCWPLPSHLHGVNVLTNRLTSPTLTLVRGVDYFIQDGVIAFVQDPFTQPELPLQQLFSGNTVTDTAVVLWAYRSRVDADTVRQQLGYVLGEQLSSTAAALSLLNAVCDGLVDGTAVQPVERAIAAICDIPLVQEAHETVQYVLRDTRAVWVITDKHAYSHHIDAVACVAVGDVVRRGQCLTDTLKFYDFNRGQVPLATEIPAVAVSPNLLTPRCRQDLVFENKDVPLEIVETTDGYTRVEFAIRGLPGDVVAFWDELHSRGVAANQTLAMLLDRRENKVGQPQAMNLPTTINPLQFLCRNVFRNNLTIVRIRTSLCGPSALGLFRSRLLRKLIPPHTTLLILTQISGPPDEIELTDTGTPHRAGYEEAVRAFLGVTSADELDPAECTDERIRAFQIHGRCE